MKTLLSLTLFAASFAGAQPAVTFNVNLNSATIAFYASLGWPLTPVPQLQAFIAGNVAAPGVYLVTATYPVGTAGALAQATAWCVASTLPYDGAGNTVTQCVVYADIPTGAEIRIVELPVIAGSYATQPAGGVK